MNTAFNIPINARTIGGAAALTGVVIVYVLFADFRGVLGGALLGAAIGCLVSGIVGLYRYLFVLE